MLASGPYADGLAAGIDLRGPEPLAWGTFRDHDNEQRHRMPRASPRLLYSYMPPATASTFSAGSRASPRLMDIAEEGEGVDDPVAEPASRRVQHHVPGAEVPQGFRQVRDVRLAVEHRDGRLPPALARDALLRWVFLLADSRARHGSPVDVPRDVLELPLLQAGLRGEVEALRAEAVHRGGHGHDDYGDVGAAAIARLSTGGNPSQLMRRFACRRQTAS